jgi:CheY-like chemotaxis protein
LKEFSHSAKLSAESLLGLINDVVEISKIQDGSAEVVKSELNIRAEIEKLTILFKPHLAQKNLKLELMVDENIPEKIIVDQQKYILLLTNLLRNAIHVSEEGTIQFSIKASKDKKGWPLLISTIKDSSNGVSEEELDNFINYDLNSSKNNDRNITSSILHIMIARELSIILEGELNATSEIGEGSKFTLSISLESSLKENSESSFGEMPSKIEYSTKPRLLLVEDNPISRKVEQKLLQEAGYDVTCVESGADAIIHVEQGGYNVVLMDIELKDMNGLEATKLIRQLPEAVKDVPIIAVTAHSSMKDREKCLLAGMNDYISKPINITFLKMTIDQWLQQAKMN